MVRRSGVTLVEVLVAIFVTAIGLLSLLTLFLLGAINMAQAIKDNRTGLIAANAASFAKFMGAPAGVRNDPNVLAAWNLTTHPMPEYPAPAAGGPSYPVYVDPFGLQLLGGTALPPDYRVGTLSTSATPTPIRRVTLSTITTPNQQVPRWFSLLDDMSFDADGTPKPSGPALIERAGRYRWGYMCREVHNLSPGQVDLTVVVYDHRPLYTSSNGQVPQQLAGENVYTGLMIANPGGIPGAPGPGVQLTWNPAIGQDAPAVRKGGWILDGSAGPPIQGFFYRVIGITQPSPVTGAGPNSVFLELQTKPRWDSPSALIVVMEGVTEVFEMGQN